ncbi:TonB family C-terminal domain-containing protein [Tenacibaculum sp. MAR_2009_124]|uniref:energy transducer TonB n=1 Tax=Tenacibaculum sp. MAR_2009_124 TaxID=1250059 RepID=UPI000894598B|nr:energy transducer TonB [Tenacibaculum sp. MAR_2009_124]SEB68276.1 TonB family C-terminal domain-containing protein [Tenacibaculum sp. MAR_2009_124]
MKTKVISIVGIAFILSAVLYGFNSKQEKKKKMTRKSVSKISYGFDLPDKPNNELSYVIKRRDNKVVVLEKLKTARKLSDFIEYFPHNWIYEYESVVIQVVSNGVEKKALSKNNFLTPEQQKLLKSAKMLDLITMKVKYETKNPVTNKKERNVMNFAFRVSPKHEAEYIGGYYKMIQYLKKNTRIEVLNWSTDIKRRAIINFWIDKKGEVINLTIKESSGNDRVDEELIKLLKSMPNWNPAKTNDGIPAIQEFEFAIGGDMC